MTSELPDGAKRPLRTVTDPVRERADVEMDAVGWLVFLTLVVLVVPLVPVLVAVWAVAKLLEFGRRQTG